MSNASHTCSRRSFLESSVAALPGAALIAGRQDADCGSMPSPSDSAHGVRSTGGDQPDGRRRESGWPGPPIWPRYETLEKMLADWQKRHPQRMQLDRLGLSAEGRAVNAVTLTDMEADETAQEHVLITALHAGLERGAATTVMAIIEWLLSDDAAAREILRRQRIVCLPVPDPDRYVRGEVSPLYSREWSLEGHRRTSEIPEAGYVRQVIDQLQPELHADIHGANLGFRDYISFDSSRGPNPGLYPYHRQIVELMDAAALAAGYPSDTSEDDAERIPYGPELATIRDRCWRAVPRFNAGTYAYARYHSLTTAAEVFWEHSGLVRHRRLLEIGNAVWPGETEPGYPTRVIMGNLFARLVAYGRTAAERRASRVELWNRLSEFTLGTLDPAVEGKAMCVFATTPAAEQRFLAEPSLQAVLNRMRDSDRLNSDSIADFVRGWPAGQNHPEAWFTLQRRGVDQGVGNRNVQSVTGTPQPLLGTGISLRLRIPYGRAHVTDLRLNGHPVANSKTDGATFWRDRGSTLVQINIPRQRVQVEEFLVVTCEYDPREQRRHWDSWRQWEDER